MIGKETKKQGMKREGNKERVLLRIKSSSVELNKLFLMTEEDRTMLPTL